MKSRTGAFISAELSNETQNRIGQHFGECRINNDLHCTIIFDAEFKENLILESRINISCTFKKFSLFGTKKDTLVIELNSRELKARNKELTKINNFKKSRLIYKPHISLGKVDKNIDLSKLKDINFNLNFTEEKIKNYNLKEEINETKKRDFTKCVQRN